MCALTIIDLTLGTTTTATIYQTSIGLSPLKSKVLAAANGEALIFMSQDWLDSRCVTGTEYFLASFIAVYTIEKLGRRKLMLFGAGKSLRSH